MCVCLCILFKYARSPAYTHTSRMDLEETDVSLKSPFTCVVAGPTGCGKTVFVRKLLASDLIFPHPRKVIWCYSEWQSAYEEINAKFVEGLTEEDCDLIIIDDLMDEFKKVVDLFTKKSHHRNTSVVFVVQNIFVKGLRTISLNAHYLVLFKNPRDSAQITYLGRQMGNSKAVTAAYKDATSKPYGYLFVDMKQDTPETTRLRAGLFEQMYVYVPKSI